MTRITRSDEQAWRALAMAAMEPSTPADTLLARVKATAGRVMPCERRSDQSAFVALQAMARAAAEGTRARHAILADCLGELAADCAQVAGWTRPHAVAPAANDGGVRLTLDLFAA